MIIFGDFNSIPTNASVRKIAIHRPACPYDRCGIRHDAQYYQKDHFDGQASDEQDQETAAVTRSSCHSRSGNGWAPQHPTARIAELAAYEISRIHQGWLANASLIELKFTAMSRLDGAGTGGIPLECPSVGRTALQFPRDHLRADRQRLASADVPQGGP